MTPKTWNLQEIHADLWGPHNSPYLSGRNYVALLLDKYTRKSWILFLRLKDEFFDVFKLWLPRAKSSRYKLSCLQIDGCGEFISSALKDFCSEKGINTKYVGPYMHKKIALPSNVGEPYRQWKTCYWSKANSPSTFGPRQWILPTIYKTTCQPCT